MGIFEEKDVDSYSKFNIEAIDTVDATSPLWSKILKTVLSAGAGAAAFL